MLQMSPAALLQRGQPNVRDGPVHHLHWNTAGIEDDGDDDDDLEGIRAFLPPVHLVLEGFTAEVEVSLITEPQLVQHVWVLFEPLCQFVAALRAD